MKITLISKTPCKALRDSPSPYLRTPGIISYWDTICGNVVFLTKQ